MRFSGHVAYTREKRNAYRVLMGKPVTDGSLGRPRQRWKYNIKMDLQEIG
jgi:hypothetical protein